MDALVKILKVESVNVLNAKQIAVTFTTPVDATTAKDVTNYSLRRAGQTGSTAFTANVAATGATSELSADAKTVTITLASTNSFVTTANPLTVALSNGDQFQVITKNIKDVPKSQTVAETTTTVTYTDTLCVKIVVR